MSERVAIVGTAGSWDQTPWNDPGLHIRSLNDAYRISGFQRADQWYDFHPLDKFVTMAGPVFAHQIPPGYYCRPEGHIEWLKNQQIPVYLHPDYKTQHPDAENWAHARPFPKEEIEAHFGRYFTSSPGWMIAQAVLEGAKELHIYGIHLSTEFEYMKQRPNFEFLIGCVLGRGKRKLSVKDGLRYYETADGLVVLPEISPILQESFQYAFEPRPDGHMEPMKWELHKLAMKRNRVQVALNESAWWSPVASFDEPTPDGKMRRVRATKTDLKEQLLRLDAFAADWQDQMTRASAAGAM